MSQPEIRELHAKENPSAKHIIILHRISAAQLISLPTELIFIFFYVSISCWGCRNSRFKGEKMACSCEMSIYSRPFIRRETSTAGCFGRQTCQSPGLWITDSVWSYYRYLRNSWFPILIFSCSVTLKVTAVFHCIVFHSISLDCFEKWVFIWTEVSLPCKWVHIINDLLVNCSP